jgi:Mg2+ and Co2+ transporter CorA
MVIVIQRLIQRIANGKLDDLDAIDKKFTEFEEKLGYPPKKRFRSLVGEYDTNVIIIEMQWDSLAKMEKTMTKSFLDQEYQKLATKLDDIVEWQKIELYVPHPPFPE